MDFKNITFKGKFRDYQQRVLDNSDKYLKDGKINIVAAPGSGKTVLGLELIRRLGSPCIVLSPTTAIRQQWGERFKDLFLDSEEDFSQLFSNDLHNVKLLNSITYQALYTAIEKISEEAEEDVDCSDVDIFAAMRQAKIKTVCLDEAHHLKNEWQKALEKFISALDKGTTIISLTATPPYDSEGSEWSRYMTVCGEIDEEIFVPELVGQNTLCPHQDYIYFNYPDENERNRFNEYNERVVAALDALGKSEILPFVQKRINGRRDYEEMVPNAKQYIALAVFLRCYGLEIDKKIVREMTARRGLPSFKMEYAETALQFLIDGEMLSEEQKEELVGLLREYSLYEKRKVSLVLNEKLKRAMVSSVGKLSSISDIAKSEIASMGEKLRMLVLTDYIKKENLSKIASEEEFESVNVVSIFETLRRACPTIDIGVLSGTLVILPNSIDLSDIKHKKEPISDTDYSVVNFSGSIHRSIDYVGKLFQQGKIKILVGTKSLLGEGWDSPCINTLILASFVGSFVLSNQMRGRAIRIDKNDPDKSANIWHLVTVEPEHLFKDKAVERFISKAKDSKHTELKSCDYDVLKRRFDSFMGPNYTTGKIESGIDRITLIKPPYDKEGIEHINEEMLKLSENRADVKEKWKGEVAKGGFAVNMETEVPTEAKAPVVNFWNVAFYTLVTIVEILLVATFIGASLFSFKGFFSFILGIIVLVFLVKGIKRLASHFNPASSVKTLGTAVYKTLCECELISRDAKVETKVDKGAFSVSMQLKNATMHDQNIFNTAMTEMLSPIDNPRYILIAKNMFDGYNYKLSFACPSIIGKKKEYVEVLAKKLKKTTGKFEAVYTHREEGRSFILKCRKKSYITANEKIMGKKYKVSHWD